MSVEEITHHIINKDQSLPQLIHNSISGNTVLLNNLIISIKNLLLNIAWHSDTYSVINQLTVSAQPSIIIDLNNNIFPKVAQVHCKEQLTDYIIFWKRLLPGTGSKIDYPNVCKTLQKVPIKLENRQLPNKFNECFKEFQKNMACIQQKKVQFFEDFNDSFVTESLDDDMVSDIIEMDVQQIKQIRQIVQAGPIDQLTSEEYLKKMQNFLSLRPRTISKELNKQFNIQRIWAKQYVQNYKDFMNGGSCYLYQYFNNSNSKNSNDRMKHKDFIKQQLPNKIKQPQIQNLSIDQIKLVSDSFYIDDNQKHKINRKRIFEGQDKKQQRFSYDRQKIQTIQTPINIIKHSSQQRIGVNLGKSEKDQHFYTEQNNQGQYRRTAPNYQIKKLQQFQQQQSIKNRNYGAQRNTYNGPNLQSHKIKENSRIFNKNQDIKQQFGLDNVQDIGIIKYGRNTNQPQFILDDYVRKNPQNQRQVNLPVYRNKDNYDKNMLKTPQNNKYPFSNDSQFTPGTAFPNKGTSTSTKKLSDFKRQKDIRKKCAPLNYLTPIQGYVLKPYSLHFNQIADFTRFRRNCLQDSFTVYASQFLLVNCCIKQEHSKIGLEIAYCNQSNYPLSIQTIYRIPKCFKIQKKSKITKRFTIQEQVVHFFNLQMVLFPLESCLLNLKYKFAQDTSHLSHQNPTIIPLSITIRNFLEFLIVSQEQWKKSWVRLSSDPNNFKATRHIILDKTILSDDQLQTGLKQFRHFSSVEGYSADQYGALCRHLSYHRIVFLMRISLRVDNIMTLEMVTDRKISDQDQIQFLEYCLSVWGMLLCRIEDSSIL